MIGLDESTSSPRISRYETGAHEPPVAIAEKLAEQLNVPVAYLYCPDDRLAALIQDMAKLDEAGHQRLRECLDELLAPPP